VPITALTRPLKHSRKSNLFGGCFGMKIHKNQFCGFSKAFDFP